MLRFSSANSHSVQKLRVVVAFYNQLTGCMGDRIGQLYPDATEEAMTSQADVAAYVATTCLELRKIAASADLGLDLLVQLLDMAALEADNIRAAAKVPAGRVVPLRRS